MATHKQYSHVPVGQCKCMRLSDTWNYPQHNYAPVAQYGSKRVEITCPDCNTAGSIFYRTPKIDKASIRPDKTLIGQVVQVKRIVAWVGYAKNASTVFWTQKDEDEKCAQVLAREVKISVDRATTLLVARNFWYDWLGTAIRKRARYELLGRAFKSQPTFANRGLWFMNKSASVQINGVLRCITGVRDSGYVPVGSWDYTDDCEAPSLYNQTHHQLYYCNHSETHQRVMIYPDDVS